MEQKASIWKLLNFQITKPNLENHTHHMKMLIEWLFILLMLLILKHIMLIKPKHTKEELINSQILHKKNLLQHIWPSKHQKDGFHQPLKSLKLLKDKKQTILLIGLDMSQLKTKEVVDHAGHSQQLVQLKLSKELKRAWQSVFLNNNLLIVILHQVDVTEDIQILLSNIQLPMDLLLKVLMLTKE